MKRLQIKPFFNDVMHNYTREYMLISVIIVGFIIAAPIITQAKYADDVTSKETIVNKKNSGVLLLDRNGKQFFSFYDGKFREYTKLSDISKHVQKAVIVAEDEGFYSHNGVSINAIVGAMIANFKRGDMVYGGSTITQQLVKNTILNSQRHIFRKYEEFVLAREIEEKYSKDEILEMYLNSVYFGEGAYGIEDAALSYFNKHARDLTVSEASMLAGIITAPSRLSPISGDVAEAKERQEYVLNEMVEDTYITEKQKRDSLQQELAYSNGRKEELYRAPHFALLVKQKLIEEYGEKYLETSGLKVRTTIDLSWQAIAEKAVSAQVKNLVYSNGTNAGVVVMDPKTGDIRALVGSADWDNDKFGKVNMATTPRQPGSSFKPIVYLAGFESQTVTPATILMDVPKKFENNYRPKNYDDRFRGPVSTRYALANSLNVPAVELMSRIGVEDALAMAKRLGIHTLGATSDYGPSLVLGTGEVQLLELTSVYATFANEGVRHDPQFITSIEDRHGKEIYKQKITGEEVIDPKYVFLVSSILSDKHIRTDVFGNALDISRPAAVKTGTTENYRDAWTMGYTPSLAIGVWVGNNNNESMDTIAGSLGAAPIWRELMEEYTAGTPVEMFTAPSGVLARSVCANGNKRGFRGNTVDSEYFVEGTEWKGCMPLNSSYYAYDEERNSFSRRASEFVNRFERSVEIPRVGAAGDFQQPTLTPPNHPQYVPSPPPVTAVPPPESWDENNENNNEGERNGHWN